ncbi:MAG TPA: hypothetical protein VHN99_05455, partial [Deinococcales bacterium]|nr:hypothetical protein [Deinococcales bacterium]
PGTLRNWTRRAGTLAETIERLLVDSGRTWRINPDGKLDVLVPDWAEHPDSLTVIGGRTGANEFTCLLDEGLQPGTTANLTQFGADYACRVTRVVHRIGPELRTEVTVADGS